MSTTLSCVRPTLDAALRANRRHTRRRQRIASWYAPDPQQLDNVYRSACASAAQTHRAEVVHRHAHGDVCEPGCRLVMPCGALARLGPAPGDPDHFLTWPKPGYGGSWQTHSP
jgi:hypothetical protein